MMRRTILILAVLAVLAATLTTYGQGRPDQDRRPLGADGPRHPPKG